MATGKELQKITQARLKTVKILIKNKDWEGAAYMMGYVLECSLKAAICSTLKLSIYPEKVKEENIAKYFMTHNFLQLVVVSGLQGVFSSEGPAKAWQNWSVFTLEYQGNWTEMRYDPNRIWDEFKLKKLFKALVTSRNAIIKEVRKKW
ncbi:MAG: hypothetical protein NTV24_02950 [Candidatus Woesebacteria bacterium]|nr:hypothetical protein [Candidatus Woesebacteria bacterium]